MAKVQVLFNNTESVFDNAVENNYWCNWDKQRLPHNPSTKEIRGNYFPRGKCYKRMKFLSYFGSLT